ncbi:hypothetical protein HHI36_023398 [Cryptolaemus montrouzieri]|uniref:Uncharacterized protein n=1 Tax=Cryptolaemus montrouzieri TaxID=559131 RepID=A0ABD2PGB5_9CUCU
MLYFSKLFLSPEAVNIIVKYINQRGACEIEKVNIKSKEDKKQWVDVDESEIYKCIGLLISLEAIKSHREPVRTRYSRFDDMNTREQRKSAYKLAIYLFTTNCQIDTNTGTHLTVDAGSIQGLHHRKSSYEEQPAKYDSANLYCENTSENWKQIMKRSRK